MSRPRTKPQTGLSKERVRVLLGLTAWQVNLAVDTGLLTTTGDGRFDQKSVMGAKASKRWREKLDTEARKTAPTTVENADTPDEPATVSLPAPVEAELRDIHDNVRVHVRNRQDNAYRAILHLGPTNSGKTYDALNRLVETKSGVYAAPLRMLAREAYEKLRTRLGDDLVGLITGEESINPTAAVLCCTAEMAPREGTTLVLDEAHWAVDPGRGYAWTRLLIGAEFDNVEVAASAGAEKFLTTVLDDAHILDVERHTRLSPLKYAGEITLQNLKPQTMLVAFSQKAVHSLAKRLLDQGRTVAVLYGDLPPAARVAQIKLFMDGEVDILVTTDVIGHGINSPAANVVFAQTDKYDGTHVRDLETWEAAQVAGRAGRFGHAGAGRVFTLTGQPGFTPDSDIVRTGAAAAAGLTTDGLTIERGLLRPTITDLGNPAAHQLAAALTSWYEKAAIALQQVPGVEPVPVGPLIERWTAAATTLDARVHKSGLSELWPLTGELGWTILTTPIDTESPVFNAFILSLADQTAVRLHDVVNAAAEDARTTLDKAQGAAKTARDAMIVGRLFPDLTGTLTVTAAAVETAAAKTIGRQLAATLRTSAHGVCTTCKKPCAPHFTLCDRCHTTRLKARQEPNTRGDKRKQGRPAGHTQMRRAA